MPLRASSFLCNSFAFLRRSRKSLKFHSSLFEDPTTLESQRQRKKRGIFEGALREQ
jgi:hypothetical protein